MASKRFRKHSKKGRSVEYDFQSVLMKASRAHSEGRLIEAKNGYLKILKKKPGWGKVLNALGTVYLDQSNLEKARKCFEKAAELKPPNISACYNLGRLMQWENDHQGAVEMYTTILKEQPDFGEVWNNLGIALKETPNQGDALSCFQNAVKYAPDMAEAWNNLGVAQDEQNMFEEASRSYRKAIEIRSDYSSAHFNLGSSQQKLGLIGQAEESFKKVLEMNPDDEAAQFMLHSLGSDSIAPDNAPIEHVRRIFDQCAGSFEKTLVNDLEYQTPEILFDLVSPYIKNDMNILDLGCGTGLGAHLYRPYAKVLAGVDISSKMLEKAAEKNIYDELEEIDILQGWAFDEKFDLIYSSDVFVYVGNLNKILKPLSLNLTDRGIVAFSVEKLVGHDRDYLLHSGGRFSHSFHYVENCLELNGFKVVVVRESVIRKQSGNDVEGLLIVAQQVH